MQTVSNNSFNNGKPRFPLTQDALTLIADRFRVLGEPMRLKLIAALRDGERNVSELIADTGAQQANVSRHLHTLTQAGILSRRKSGLNVYYFISDPTIFALCEHVCGSIRKRLTQQAGSVSQNKH
jgi:ArsR family transcriptional regulator